MSTAASQYIHGTEPHEQRRLTILNDLINEGSLRELALRGGEKVLDVASGLGQLSRAMARIVRPNGSVTGIERSPEQLAEAIRQARAANEEGFVEFRQGEASAMPVRDDEWGTFDVVHTRYLLEHLRDPHAVVRLMVRAARPGGRIVLEDDDHGVMLLSPEPPGFGALWQAYVRSFERLGNDPFIGRRLVGLLREAGAEPRRNTWIFFGACTGHPTFEPLVENLIGVLVGARNLIVQQSLFDPGYFDDAIANIRTWSRRPDAAFWYSICWAEGVRPM